MMWIYILCSLPFHCSTCLFVLIPMSPAILRTFFFAIDTLPEENRKQKVTRIYKIKTGKYKWISNFFRDMAELYLVKPIRETDDAKRTDMVTSCFVLSFWVVLIGQWEAVARRIDWWIFYKIPHRTQWLHGGCSIMKRMGCWRENKLYPRQLSHTCT